MSRQLRWGLVLAGMISAAAARAGHDHPKAQPEGERTSSEARQEQSEAKGGATQAGQDVRTSTEQEPAAKGSTPATGMATTESGKAEKMGSASPENTALIKKLYSQSALDAETAKIATEKSQDEQVKKFADELARDHKRLGERLEELAAARKIELSKETALSTGQKAHVEAMKGMSTTQFEEHFKDMMVQDHDRLLKDVETGLDQANRTGDRQLAAVLQEVRPTIEEHHTAALGLGQGAAGSAGTSAEPKGSTGSTGESKPADTPRQGEKRP